MEVLYYLCVIHIAKYVRLVLVYPFDIQNYENFQTIFTLFKHEPILQRKITELH